MTTLAKTMKLLRMTAPCIAITLLIACGGGGGSSGSSIPNVTTYDISATAGIGGSISPSSAAVDAGGTVKLTVTPIKTGYAATVTGCSGTLSGNTYTTGPVNADCSVSASFSPAFTWVGGSNIANAWGLYGSQGVPAAANVPGARVDAASWTDASGNLWLFGGRGYDYQAANDFDSDLSVDRMNDLWKYSPASGKWTWVSGSSTLRAYGSYGTKGVPAASNVPGARDDAVSWMDASGNLWLFGGYGFNSSGGYLNDLWEYSPSDGEWTWVSGSSAFNTCGVYGTQGVAAATNVPGGRTYASSWTDAHGNLWLFGGFGCNSTTSSWGDWNDLWEYSPSSGEWTWVSGSSTPTARGIYGTKGVPAATNVPGARDSAVSWTDADGNFWLFGGQGVDSTGNSDTVMNDLWEFSPSSGEWTWVSGSSTGIIGIQGGNAVYGTQGLPAAANVPGARSGARGWIDVRGNLWLYGGIGYDSTGSLTNLGDLWEYSPTSGEWTWMSGSSFGNPKPIYGAQGVAAATNTPGIRGGAVSWSDASGNLWLFGGGGFDSTGASGVLNDLWEYPTL